MNVCDWAEQNWRLPGGELIELRPWQRRVLLAMFPGDGSVSPWETFLISTPKKAGKTTLDAVATLYAVLTFPAPETAFVVANDEAQAQERVFDLIVGAVRAMGLEAEGDATITRSEIIFSTGSKIVAIASDYAGAAGATFGINELDGAMGVQIRGPCEVVGGADADPEPALASDRGFLRGLQRRLPDPRADVEPSPIRGTPGRRATHLREWQVVGLHRPGGGGPAALLAR